MGSEKDKEEKSIGKIRNECRNGGREKLHRTTEETMHKKKKIGKRKTRDREEGKDDLGNGREKAEIR